MKLYLPRAKAPLERTEADSIAVCTAEFRGRHVFLVEDNETLRLTFTAQLESLGCIVHAASDGPEACELAKRFLI